MDLNFYEGVPGVLLSILAVHCELYCALTRPHFIRFDIIWQTSIFQMKSDKSHEGTYKLKVYHVSFICVYVQGCQVTWKTWKTWKSLENGKNKKLNLEKP